MDTKRRVFCPTCIERFDLTWIKSIGIYRGYCTRCKSLIYAREVGMPWKYRENKKWWSATNPNRDNRYFQIHLFLTQLTWKEFRDLFKAVWLDIKGLIR
jgi:hypothetical protein